MFTRTIRTVAQLIAGSVLLLHQLPAHAAATTLRVLATTFPLYQLTRNVSAGVDGVEVELMIPASLGCPHDYALLPQDMRKLAAADVLVVNGLGMEEFLGPQVRKANPGLTIIDSSKGIDPHLILQYGGGEGEDTHHSSPDNNGHDRAHDEHAHDSGPNPHLFASPRMAALLVGSIAQGLAQRSPAHADAFIANARNYSGELAGLADDFSALGQRLTNNRIITQHGVFDYLARDMGLRVVAVVQAHAGQDPSAAEMLAIVQAAKAEKAAAVFTEPQYPEAVGATIAREAGLRSARLDPVANGPDRAPLDYYQQRMRANLTTLEQTLGRH